MANISNAYTKQTIDKMKQYYANELVRSPQYALFQAKTPNAIITAYTSGKVVFQGQDPQTEAAKWSKYVQATKKTKKQNKNSSTPIGIQNFPKDIFQESHIGSDESGTGDYFGPITTCAVYVQEKQIELLQDIGIQDSKTIRDNHIKELAHTMIQMDIPYSVMVLHNEKYNQLQRQGWSQGKMKAMLHDGCIKSLLSKIGQATYKGIVIDQFCQPEVYKKHLHSEGKTTPENSYFITKAESYSVAVAASSIFARARFVKEMDRMSAWLGEQLVKGASPKVDKLAAQLMQKYGNSILSKIAKIHFANTKKAKHMIK